MLARGALIFFILFFIFALTAYFFDPHPRPYPKDEKAVVMPLDSSSRIPVGNSTNLKDVLEKTECTEIGATLRKHAAVSLSEQRSEVRELIAKHRDAPQYLLSQAKLGHPIASIALFSIVNSCTPYSGYFELGGDFTADESNFPNSACNKIPSEVLERPLDLLSAAANSGSSYAKYLYATNAVTFIKIQDFHDKISQSDKAKILSMAETMGREAATENVVEAYSFMAHAYVSETFGKSDLSLAYAYAVALAKVDDGSENRVRSQFIYEMLNRKQLEAANRYVESCSLEVKPSSRHYISPFGGQVGD